MPSFPMMMWTTLLGLWPLHHPLYLDEYWLWFLLPLVVAVSVVYKTIKLPDLSKLPKQAAILSMQIMVFMALVAAALWLISELA